MDLVTISKVEQFAKLAHASGWEWCGVQVPLADCGAWPTLVITKNNQTKMIHFDPNDFDPIKVASLYLAPQEKKMTDTPTNTPTWKDIPSPKLNLRQKMIQIYLELDHVAKKGDNTKQKYKFVRAADVMRPVRAVFAKYGIYAQTNYELLSTYDIKTHTGGNMHTASVKATIVLFDADSNEFMTISGLGDGADSGDKGIFKAQTGATKNALRNGLLLPDEGDPNGGDPEADQQVDERTAENYTHNEYTTELPQTSPFREVAEATAYQPSIQECIADAAPAAAPEHGDAYEGPDDGPLPTEEELVDYRSRFKKLNDVLAEKGKLNASKGLPTARKLLVFLVQITKATDPKHVTKSQWDDFFTRALAAVENPEVGFLGLTKLVNKANGIEDKK